MTGPRFGLSLVMNINQETYMTGGQTRQAGARLVVHEIGQRALPDEFGHDLMPNALTRVAVQELNITRLEDPYTSNCTMDWSKSNYSDFVPSSSDFWNYSLPVITHIILIGCLLTIPPFICICPFLALPEVLPPDELHHGLRLFPPGLPRL